MKRLLADDNPRLRWHARVNGYRVQLHRDSIFAGWLCIYDHVGDLMLAERVTFALPLVGDPEREDISGWMDTAEEYASRHPVMA